MLALIGLLLSPLVFIAIFAREDGPRIIGAVMMILIGGSVLAVLLAIGHH